jgi:hypothetical protein
MVLRYGYRSRAAVNLTLCVSDTSAMKFECPSASASVGFVKITSSVLGPKTLVANAAPARPASAPVFTA